MVGIQRAAKLIKIWVHKKKNSGIIYLAVCVFFLYKWEKSFKNDLDAFKMTAVFFTKSARIFFQYQLNQTSFGCKLRATAREINKLLKFSFKNSLTTETKVFYLLVFCVCAETFHVCLYWSVPSLCGQCGVEIVLKQRSNRVHPVSGRN